MKADSEVLAHLVVAAVFKTVGPQVNLAAGGFDSHALPLRPESSGAVIEYEPDSELRDTEQVPL